MTKGIAEGAGGAPGGAMDAATRREVNNARRATAVGVLAVLFLVALACITQRDQIRDRENERAENLARAFDFHVHHEIQSVDDLLRQLRRMPLDTAQGFHDAVAELRAGELGQRSIQFALIGADGYLQHSSESGARRVNLGDREHFTTHLDPGLDRLFVSRPIIGRISGQLSIQFSRRYVDAAGRFRGVVVVSMPPGFLTDGAQALGLRSEDVAAILRHDGYLLSRTPVMPAPAVMLEKIPPGFLQHLEGREVGLFELRSPIDHVRRLGSFRKSAEFPVTAIVAPSTRQRDAEQEQAAWRHLVLALVMVGLLLAFHFHHERSLRFAGRLRQQGERERQHLAEAQAIAKLGSWQFDPRTHRLNCSDEVYRILGRVAGDGTTGQWLALDDFLAQVHADDRPAVDAAFGWARESGESFELRHRIVRPHGAIRHVIQHGRVELDDRRLLSRFTGTLQDVTAALEAELRELEAARSDRLARAVFDGVTQPMLVLSSEGRLLNINAAFEETFGVSGQELLGRLLAEVEASPEGAVPFACRPSRLFRHDQPVGEWEGDVTVSRDGHDLVLALSLSGIRDAEGRFEHYVGIYTDVTQRRRREDKATHQARHDPLTGLPNRQYALERLARSLNRSRRKQTRGVVIFIDLDHFKEINDTYGHDAGDEVLRVIARRFQSAVRQEDMVARLGGDEFIALIEEVANLDVGRRVAEALRAAAAEPVAYSVNCLLSVSASLGVAVFPHENEGVEALLMRADLAMYEAKRDGRDAIRFFGHDDADREVAGELAPTDPAGAAPTDDHL